MTHKKKIGTVAYYVVGILIYWDKAIMLMVGTKMA